MVNRAFTGGVASSDSFDPFSAVMIRGLHWLLTGGAQAAQTGLQPYPRELEHEVASVALAARTR
jgi:adenosylhomocysteinase